MARGSSAYAPGVQPALAAAPLAPAHEAVAKPARCANGPIRPHCPLVRIAGPRTAQPGHARGALDDTEGESGPVRASSGGWDARWRRPNVEPQAVQRYPAGYSVEPLAVARYRARMRHTCALVERQTQHVAPARPPTPASLSLSRVPVLGLSSLTTHQAREKGCPAPRDPWRELLAGRDRPSGCCQLLGSGSAGPCKRRPASPQPPPIGDGLSRP